MRSTIALPAGGGAAVSSRSMTHRACAAAEAGRKPAQVGTALGLRVADKCHRALIIYRAAAIDADVLFSNIVDR
jgi:hypothetical protein